MSGTGPTLSVIIPCHRAAADAIRLAHALRVQVLDGEAIELIVVDDGSGDGTADALAAGLPQDAVLLALDANRGRAGARAAGAAIARGRALAFIDADCLPGSPRLLASHLAALSRGAIASTGPIHGQGHGFWHRYQVAVSARRARAHARGERGIGSTANLVVDAEAFVRCGGFDPGFGHYGFEDTDLLLRLDRHGRIAWSEDAEVSHMDAVSMPAVARKLREAGRHGATRMEARHAAWYAGSRNARVDARRHPALRPLGWIARPLLQPTANLLEHLLERRWLPWPVLKGAVAALSALAYLVGTCDALRDGASSASSRAA